jgi:hypothetical protein
MNDGDCRDAILASPNITFKKRRNVLRLYMSGLIVHLFIYNIR